MNIESILKNGKEINFISENIYDPFKSVLNYLNILFNLCKTSNDYNKLLHLVKIIETKKEIKALQFNKVEKKLSLSEICIFDHMNYIFRKVYSSKERGKEEIKYCNQIIEIIFKNIIKDKKEEEVINILKFGERYDIEIFRYSGNSFINSIILNTYLIFEDKIEIISKLNEVTGGLGEEDIFKNFPIYFLFKDSKQSKLDIIKFQDINLYFIYDKYKYLMDLFGKEQNSLEKYIKLFHNYLFQINFWKFYANNINCYLSLNSVKAILEKIKLYGNRIYENKYENNQYVYKSFDIEKVELEFILIDKALCEVILSDIFERKNNLILAVKILFSFKYDFCDFIDKNSEAIIKCINNNNDVITYYLLSLDILDNNSNIDLQYKIISRLIKFGIILNRGDYYYNKIIRNFVKLSFIISKNSVYRRIFSSLEWFFHSATIFLVTKWDKPFKNFYITNKIINNIEFYCILIIDNFPTFIEQKKAIEFFFDEFILLLDPEMKDRLKYYKQICFDYMHAINSQQKEEEVEKFNVEEKNEEELYTPYYRKGPKRIKNIFFFNDGINTYKN